MDKVGEGGLTLTGQLSLHDVSSVSVAPSARSMTCGRVSTTARLGTSAEDTTFVWLMVLWRQTGGRRRGTGDRGSERVFQVTPVKAQRHQLTKSCSSVRLVWLLLGVCWVVSTAH